MRRLLISLLVVVVTCTDVGAGVAIEDSIALTGKSHMLTAVTSGRFFPKGGEVVEFFVNDKSIGRNLSGGDGRALKEYTPATRGLYRIRAVSGGQKGGGMLLSLEQGEAVVFIDIEGGLPEGVFPMKPGEGAQTAIELISERFPVVYLQTAVPDKGLLSSWLLKHGFQEAPIIRWNGGGIFDDVAEYGLKVRAVIGAPPVIESATGHTEALFSIQETEGAELIREWKGLNEKIR